MVTQHMGRTVRNTSQLTARFWNYVRLYCRKYKTLVEIIMYKCCIISFGWFPSIWILCSDVSEHCQFLILGDSPVYKLNVADVSEHCQLHLHRWFKHTTYEDGTDRILRNVGT